MRRDEVRDKSRHLRQLLREMDAMKPADYTGEGEYNRVLGLREARVKVLRCELWDGTHKSKCLIVGY
jgi:hypothetical protein